MNIKIKLTNKYRIFIERVRALFVSRQLDLSDITIFSQNCIGGVLYHDCRDRFLSPTINLYMLPADFMRFVNNYSEYVNKDFKFIDHKKYPVGEFDDKLRINFMHYATNEDALKKWNDRCKRINQKKIFVICVERDGFSENDYKEFKKLKYPKILFTNKVSRKEDKECIYLPKYKNDFCVPDLIPYREIYYKNKLVKSILKAFE